jgi:hypothetical protein
MSEYINNKVYLIGFKLSGVYLIKIGVSRNIERRIKELSTAVPFKIQYYISIRDTLDAYNVEAYLHKQLKVYNINSEWFRFTYSIKEIETLIKELLVDNNQPFTIRVNGHADIETDVLSLVNHTYKPIEIISKPIFNKNVDIVNRYIERFKQPVSYAIEQLKLKNKISNDYSVYQYNLDRKEQKVKNAEELFIRKEAKRKNNKFRGSRKKKVRKSV